MSIQQPTPTAKPRIFQYPQTPKQIEAIKHTAKILLLDGPRNCVDASTIICVNGRLKRIEQLAALKRGDNEPTFIPRLLSFDTNAMSSVESFAARVMRPKNKQCVEVLTHNGYSLKCSDGHQLWSEYGFVKASDLNGKWIPMKIGTPSSGGEHTTVTIDVRSREDFQREEADRKIHGNELFLGKISRKRFMDETKTTFPAMKRYEASGPSVPPSVQIVLDEDIGYFLGLLAGDGCTTKKVLRRNLVGYSSIDPFLISEINRIASRFGAELQHTSRCNYRFSKTSGSLIALLEQLGMDVYSHEKKIPDAILESKPSVLAAFISGLFDTDGWACAGYAGYASSSLTLARQVQDVLLHFGIRSTMRRRKNDHKGSNEINIRADVLKFQERIGFRLERKYYKLGTIRHYSGKSAYPEALRDVLIEIWGERHSRGMVGLLSRSERKRIVEGLLTKTGTCQKSLTISNVKEFCSVMRCEFDPRVRKFVGDWDIFWERVDSVTPCEADLYDLSVPNTNTYIGNGFVNHNCGKTQLAMHRIARHLWEVPCARFLFLGRSQTDVKDGGSWTTLVNNVLPYWMEPTDQNGDKFKMMRWVREPSGGDAGTHHVKFVVSNRFWNNKESDVENLKHPERTSECYMMSAYRDDDIFIKDLFRNKTFTGAYIAELTKFGNPALVTEILEVLRPLQGMHDNFHQFFQITADCNPDVIRGQRSWVYRQFYWFLALDLNAPTDEEVKLLGLHELDKDELPKALEDLREHQTDFAVMQFTLDDATWQDERWHRKQRAKWRAQGPNAYAAYVEGKWVVVQDRGAVFGEFWVPSIHIVEPTIISSGHEYVAEPADDIFEVQCGVDLGDSKNSAMVFAHEMTINSIDRSGNVRPVTAFFVFDEWCIIGKAHRTLDVVNGVQDSVMDFWEQRKAKALQWHFWSDTSSFKQRSLNEHNTVAMEVADLSEGRIKLRQIDKQVKKRGGLLPSIEFVKRLLHERRILISSRCHNLIEAVETIKWATPGKIDEQHPAKHSLDALRYLVMTRARDSIIMRPSNLREGTLQIGSGQI